MKKLLCVLSLTGLLLGLGVAANAETGGTQQVDTNVPGPSWELVIPDKQEIPFRQTETDIVHSDCTIENVQHLPSSKMINAYLTHTGVFTMTGTGNENKTISFLLRDYDGNWVAANNQKLTVASYWRRGDWNFAYSNVNVVISEQTWEAAEAGEYKTPVTYTSALEDYTTPPSYVTG